MENIKDWCISRQLWWGHRIPAWYCAGLRRDGCSQRSASYLPQMRQQESADRTPDTLDTWFSSALWPFSTLGLAGIRPRNYKYFYPTSTLVTGYDIIFFWVARMIFSGMEHMGKVPFQHGVYPRPRAGCAGTENVQVFGQRHRPAGGHR